jgi:hypothetical protein
MINLRNIILGLGTIDRLFWLLEEYEGQATKQCNQIIYIIKNKLKLIDVV